MELTGVLAFYGGRYWVCNSEEAWLCPLGVGDRAEVLVGGEWRAVTMQSGRYGGWYWRFADGQWSRLASCMQVRLVKM